MPGGGGNSTSQDLRTLRSTGCSELKAFRDTHKESDFRLEKPSFHSEV